MDEKNFVEVMPAEKKPKDPRMEKMDAQFLPAGRPKRISFRQTKKGLIATRCLPLSTMQQ